MVVACQAPQRRGHSHRLGQRFQQMVSLNGQKSSRNTPSTWLPSAPLAVQAMNDLRSVLVAMGNPKGLAWTSTGSTDPCGGYSSCIGVPVSPTPTRAPDSSLLHACAWANVTCQGSRVVGVDASCRSCTSLSRVQLPKSLSYLDALISFNISSNAFTGGLL